MAVVKFFASALGAYAFYELLKIVYGELTSSLRSLPGPKSAHWLYGNYVQLALDVGAPLYNPIIFQHLHSRRTAVSNYNGRSSTGAY
jgi:hypothetical protein